MFLLPTRVDVSSALSIEQSAIYYGCGKDRDRGRGRNFGGNYLFGAGRSFLGGRQSAPYC